MGQTILYDLPSKEPCKSWSLNPWKTRLALNFKGIDYRTEWVEYPDLEPVFKSLGIPPTDPGAIQFFRQYTSPTVQFEDGTKIMDSWPIAHEIEKRYPSPSLYVDDPVVVTIRDAIPKIFGPLRGISVPMVPPRLLNERSAEYFYRTRKEDYGKSLQEVLQEQDVEKCWKEIGQPAKEVGDLLRKHGGPYFLGKTVSYADFIFVALLHFLKRIDEGFFQRYLSVDPAFKTVYDACSEWLKKDD
ncbi:hypothetical protein K491DRAFT_75327 [Lophiostoma macrostomum CBS 122681]|uniref:Uncharacterized protein n=1 Tax=Lophiostoma macrostomum CBS 122681 TaxID=1314788 RepID=A0A6A6SZA4_9PLEO|nr:hypothetical protein K491DRAFT_75327 [Lophiostoma macrostomum CBS 122681]